MDLKNRPGKAGGGFCTSFPTEGVPFIFANFNGTHHDIGVFTHEMGHAFQNWESRDLAGRRLPLADDGGGRDQLHGAGVPVLSRRSASWWARPRRTGSAACT